MKTKIRRSRRPKKLIDLYFESVGRGASLLLNVPPNRSGLLQGADAKSLAEFRRKLNELFAVDLVNKATVRASNTRGGSRKFGTSNLDDNNPETYWATDDSVRTAYLIVDLEGPRQVSIVRLREAISMGQSCSGFRRRRLARRLLETDRQGNEYRGLQADPSGRAPDSQVGSVFVSPSLTQPLPYLN